MKEKTLYCLVNIIFIFYCHTYNKFLYLNDICCTRCMNSTYKCFLNVRKPIHVSFLNLCKCNKILAITNTSYFLPEWHFCTHRLTYPHLWDHPTNANTNTCKSICFLFLLWENKINFFLYEYSLVASIEKNKIILFFHNKKRKQIVLFWKKKEENR